MTDTEPTTEPDAITDLSQGRWSTRHYTPDNWASDVEPMGGWHVVGEVGDDPDPHSRERFDLWVQNAHDGDGGDCSAWLADMVARKLSETDQTIRWQRDRAVQSANEAGHAITKALDALNNAQGEYATDERLIDEAERLLRPYAREAP